MMIFLILPVMTYGVGWLLTLFASFYNSSKELRMLAFFHGYSGLTLLVTYNALNKFHGANILWLPIGTHILLIFLFTSQWINRMASEKEEELKKANLDN